MAIAVPYWVSQAKGETGKAWCTQIRPHYGVGATGWMSDLNGRAQPITVYIHVAMYQDQRPPYIHTNNQTADGWYVDVEASNVGAGRACTCYIEAVNTNNSAIYEGTLSATADGNGYLSRRRLGRVHCYMTSREGSSDYEIYGHMTFRIRIRSADGHDYYSGNYYVKAS